MILTLAVPLTFAGHIAGGGGHDAVRVALRLNSVDGAPGPCRDVDPSTNGSWPTCSRATNVVLDCERRPQRYR
jgi:hypothetical protein